MDNNTRKPKYIGLKISVTGFFVFGLLCCAAYETEPRLYEITKNITIFFVALMLIFGMMAANYQKASNDHLGPMIEELKKSKPSDISITFDDTGYPHIMEMDCSATPWTVKRELMISPDLLMSSDPLELINYLYNTYHYVNLSAAKKIIDLFCKDDKDQSLVKRYTSFCTIQSLAIKTTKSNQSDNYVIAGVIIDIVLENEKIVSVVICRELDQNSTLYVLSKDFACVNNIAQIIPGLYTAACAFLERSKANISFTEKVNATPQPTGRNCYGYFITSIGIYRRIFQMDNLADPFVSDLVQLVVNPIKGYIGMEQLKGSEIFIISNKKTDA